MGNHKLVTAKTVLGEGRNRLELYPLNGETTERQLMVYFPAQRILYGDAFQEDGKGGYFSPQAMNELSDAVVRARINVNTFFMMHISPTPWSKVGEVISNDRVPGRGVTERLASVLSEQVRIFVSSPQLAC